MNANIRSAIYALSVFVNATVGVLMTEIDLSIYVLAGLAGFNAVVALLARANVTPDVIE